MFRHIILIVIVFVVCNQAKRRRNIQTRKFSSCGDTYQCFGLPDKCVTKKDCTVLLKTRPLLEDKVEYNLFWKRAADSAEVWVAAGLSSDALMGDDLSTIFTIEPNGTVTLEEGLTFHNPDERKAGVTPYQLLSTSLIKQDYSNGWLTAKWNRERTTSVGGLVFDTKAQKYYIMLAFGQITDGIKGHHTERWVTESPVQLSEQ